MSVPLSSPAHIDVSRTPRSRHLRAVGAGTPTDSGDPTRASLPPPLPALEPRVIGAIAVFAFEAVEGARQVAQLGRWITDTVAAQLSELRRLNVERRSLYRDSRRIVPAIQRVRTTRPNDDVTEAAVVLSTPSRSRAVALRFEAIRGRWQATSITVL
ncbi:hypothetical protein FB468_1665 [Leucobacter komagatae]|uniref:3-hydroxyacyl-CoA dehydrogenase n=1 Tax=Leucobacter komagatae TaxID=55969 RepID=A0A542Y6E1_9MICO|nr:Rv3235 family protein [Leucobacter komagatae]TQL43636.1 hypothetical protein FB468_1665 [Leucobacter komagatae]